MNCPFLLVSYTSKFYLVCQTKNREKYSLDFTNRFHQLLPNIPCGCLPQVSTASSISDNLIRFRIRLGSKAFFNPPHLQGQSACPPAVLSDIPSWHTLCRVPLLISPPISLPSALAYIISKPRLSFSFQPLPGHPGKDTHEVVSVAPRGQKLWNPQIQYPGHHGCI